jgi:anti-sigma regulatory factor (Ser/Thr protein kinase)
VTPCPETAPGDTFEHEALFYRGDQDFLAGLLPYVREGLERDEAVLVAEPAPRLAQLRDALGDDAAAVTFLDMADIGGNPARIIGVWATALEEHAARGRQLRGVGEPAYAGRRTVEYVECRLHELLLNRAFDGGRPWRLLCPYDQLGLPGAVSRAALQTHPLRSTSANRRRSDEYAADGWLDAFGAPLPRPLSGVLRGTFGAHDLTATRHTVAQYARTCGLDDDQVEILELAASELSTNSVRHGGGAGTVAMWRDFGAVIVEFSDLGHLTDPLTGRLTPPVDSPGGRGVYLVNQLCDLVQLRSSPEGTTVRVLTWV